MNDSITEEIARRLGTTSSDVETVLDTVVQRIRQQVEHYGYARLAGLGTFRGRDGDIVFEPDAGLNESINARFSGLTEIVLEPASAPDEVPAPPEEDEPTESMRPETLAAGFEGIDLPEEHTVADFEGTAVPEDLSAAEFEGTEIPEDHSKAGFEGTEIPEEGDEDAWGSQGELEAEPEDDLEDDLQDDPEDEYYDYEGEEDDAPDFGRHVSETTPETAEDEFEGEQEDEKDEAPEDIEEDLEEDLEEDAFWTDYDAPGDEHPLGPESEPPYEDADYSFVGDRGAKDDDESVGTPTVSWAPLAPGEERPQGDEEPDRPAPFEEEDLDNAVDGDEEDSASLTADEKAEARRKANIAPDRPAHAHGLRDDGPVRTINPPSSRASRKGPDPKAIWFGVGIIVLVAAAAAAYFLIPDRPTGPAPSETTQAEQPPPADTAATALADTMTAEAATPPPPPDTPLRSEQPIDLGAGGYTIVVLSDTNPTSAESAAQQFRDQGFRTGVIASQQDGVTRYRVGVGQFDTVDEATQMRSELAGADLPADAWVLRI